MSQNSDVPMDVSPSFKGFALHPELALSIDAGVAMLEMCRPPYNFFDEALIVGLVDALRYLDTLDECRVVVLASRGKTFCAGADFSNDSISSQGIGKRLYSRALEMFRTKKPIVCAVQGAAVGGGLGLALVGDFRVVSPGTRMAANFLRLGIHPGFGLTATLPRLVGPQKAAMLFYTGRRIGGAEALDMGLADVLVEDGQVLEGALALAREISISAPIALVSTRETLHQGLAALVEAAMGREAEEQDKHWLTQDFKEGVAAMAARRDPVFKGY